VLAPGNAPAGVVTIAFALQREAKGINEQLMALLRIGGDNSHGPQEENVHVHSVGTAADDADSENSNGATNPSGR